MEKLKIDIDRLESIAKIELNDKQKDKLSEFIFSISNRLDKLSSLDYTDIADKNVTEMRLREDCAANSFDKNELLRCAPQRDDDYIVIPRVVE